MGDSKRLLAELAAEREARRTTLEGQTLSPAAGAPPAAAAAAAAVSGRPEGGADGSAKEAEGGHAGTMSRNGSGKEAEGGVECVCCMEGFTSSSPPLVLPCHRDHQMHKPCISRWAEACKSQDKAVSCPLCRRGFSLTEVNDHLGASPWPAEEARGGGSPALPLLSVLRCDHRDESGHRCAARSELFDCPGCDQSFCVDHLTECDLCGEEYCASECIRTCVSCERSCCFECCDEDTEEPASLWRCSECVEAQHKALEGGRKRQRSPHRRLDEVPAGAAAGPDPRASVAGRSVGQRINEAGGFGHGVQVPCASCRQYLKSGGLAACQRCRSRLCLASCLSTCASCKSSLCSECRDCGWELVGARGATSKWKCSLCVRKNEDTQQRLDREHRAWLMGVAQRREKAAAKKQQEAVRRKKQNAHDQLLAQVVYASVGERCGVPGEMVLEGGGKLNPPPA